MKLAHALPLNAFRVEFRKTLVDRIEVSLSLRGHHLPRMRRIEAFEHLDHVLSAQPLREPGERCPDRLFRRWLFPR